jgi:hypothetical protein
MHTHIERITQKKHGPQSSQMEYRLFCDSGTREAGQERYRKPFMQVIEGLPVWENC